MPEILLKPSIDNPVEPRLRNRGLLTQVAPELELGDTRWMSGLSFIGFAPGDKPETYPLDWCADDDLDTRRVVTSGFPQFRPFAVWDLESCSSLSVEMDYLMGRSTRRVALWESYMLARELVSGHTTGNPSLSSAASAPVSTPTKALRALTVIEALWANDFGNQEALIHMHPAVLTLLADHLTRTATSWETATGHTVITDAGYGYSAPGAVPLGDGDEPGDHTVAPTADANVSWVYASGPVGWKTGLMSSRQTDVTMDWERNEMTGRSTKIGIAVFDPASVIAVPVSTAEEDI